MPSQETLEEYRRMTPGERLELTFELIRENTLRDRNIMAALQRLPRRLRPDHD